MQAQCKATARSGAQCSNPPIQGGTVCRMHGGGSPAVKAAAARRLEVAAVEADVRAVIASEGLEPVTEPLEALALLATESLAMKSALAARVNALQEISTTSKLGVESLKAEIGMYERALERSAKFLDLLVKAGLEERRLLLSEAQAQLVFEFMTRIFNAIGLTPEQRALLPDIIPGELARMQSEQVNGKQAAGPRGREQ